MTHSSVVMEELRVRDLEYSIGHLAENSPNPTSFINSLAKQIARIQINGIQDVNRLNERLNECEHFRRWEAMEPKNRQGFLYNIVIFGMGCLLTFGMMVGFYNG